MIAVLTKTDALRVPALNQYMRENGLTIKEAMSSAGEMAAQMLRRLREKIESQLSGCKHPPKAYLEMACGSSGSILSCIHSDLDTSIQVWTKRVQIVDHF